MCQWTTINVTPTKHHRNYEEQHYMIHRLMIQLSQAINVRLHRTNAFNYTINKLWLHWLHSCHSLTASRHVNRTPDDDLSKPVAGLVVEQHVRVPKAVIITSPWSHMKPCVCLRPSPIRTLSACSVTRPLYVRVLVEAESRPPRSPCQGYGPIRSLKSNQHRFTSSTCWCS